LPKISRQTKEIINTILFFAVLGLLITFYMVYPLNRTKAFMARADIDDFHPDSIVVNNTAAFVEAGLAPDSFAVETDGQITLAVSYLSPQLDDSVGPKGTVVLLHDDGEDSQSMAPAAQRLLKEGYAVLVYDQRAGGFSTGKYRSDGSYEASDLAALVSYFDLRQKAIRPLTVVGYSTGGDAGLLAALEEDRIDGVLAVNPYLSSTRMLDIQKRRNDAFWFPFYRTTMWWWYEMRSSYATEYRGLEQVRPVACRTLLLIEPDLMEDEEVVRIGELSSDEKLEVKPLMDDSVLLDQIVSFVGSVTVDQSGSDD
jgi:pimeloyl-ACP methyl ester carboxylesterase